MVKTVLICLGLARSWYVFCVSSPFNLMALKKGKTLVRFTLQIIGCRSTADFLGSKLQYFPCLCAYQQLLNKQRHLKFMLASGAAR